MKMNQKWRWAISAIIYVMFVLLGHFIYSELSSDIDGEKSKHQLNQTH
ncbi:hypothetical protein [Bacillus sp. NPDC077027]